MDAILSVRISDELKQKFNELAKNEGINNKELMEQVVKYYELNRAREENSTMSEDIKELQTITSRMADIYINIVEKTNVKTLELKNIHRNELIDNNIQTENLKEELTLLKEDNKKINSLGKELSETKHINKELQENIKSLKTLNNMQEEKISKLSESNKEYIKYKEEIIKLKIELEKSRGEIKQFNNELSIKKNEEDRLKKQIGDLEESNKNKINELQIKAIQDIEMQKERTSLQVANEILKLKEEQQLKVQELQENFSNKINNLLKEKEEASERFRNVILEIDRKKSEPLIPENK